MSVTFYVGVKGERPSRPTGPNFHNGGATAVLRAMGLPGEPWGCLPRPEFCRRVILALNTGRSAGVVTPEEVGPRHHIFAVTEEGVRERLVRLQAWLAEASGTHVWWG